MSRFIELYQERQAIKRNLKKIRRKASPEEYWKLKAEEKGLTERMDEIIKKDKDGGTENTIAD